MSGRLPLSALLSQALVAFTIELDNAFESQMPHRTTRHGGTRGAPWAVSLAMWSNCMRLVDEGGVPVRELERRARATPHLSGMQRWGYVVVEPDPADRRPSPPRRDWLMRPTDAGRRAQEVWRPLPAAIEARWRERFGAESVSGLRAGLQALVDRVGLGLPEFLTSLYGGYAAVPPGRDEDQGAVDGPPGRLPLSALLSQTLHAFALEFERESKASLMYSANVIRVLDRAGVPVRDLPRRSGVAIEPITTALGILAKRGHVVVEADPGGARGKAARLTPKGGRAHDVYQHLPGEIEQRWRARFGAGELDAVRQPLEAMVTAPDGERSPLWLGLEPPAGTWRTKVRRPEVLPHHPMPRQGGHPDGS
jgi:DNA-binding MarR family transcriptional regulator